jgi:hypothetical protein
MRVPSYNAYCVALLLALVLLCAAGATPASIRAASSNFQVYLPLLTRAAQPSIEQQVIDLANQQRQLHGCTALVRSAQLSAAAYAHSEDMALRNLGVGYYAQMDDQANVRLETGQLSGPFRYYWTQDFGSP